MAEYSVNRDNHLDADRLEVPSKFSLQPVYKTYFTPVNVPFNTTVLDLTGTTGYYKKYTEPPDEPLTFTVEPRLPLTGSPPYTWEGQYVSATFSPVEVFSGLELNTKYGAANLQQDKPRHQGNFCWRGDSIFDGKQAVVTWWRFNSKRFGPSDFWYSYQGYVPEGTTLNPSNGLGVYRPEIWLNGVAVVNISSMFGIAANVLAACYHSASNTIRAVYGNRQDTSGTIGNFNFFSFIEYSLTTKILTEVIRVPYSTNVVSQLPLFNQAADRVVWARNGKIWEYPWGGTVLDLGLLASAPVNEVIQDSYSIESSDADEGGLNRHISTQFWATEWRTTQETILSVDYINNVLVYGKSMYEEYFKYERTLRIEVLNAVGGVVDYQRIEHYIELPVIHTKVTIELDLEGNEIGRLTIRDDHLGYEDYYESNAELLSGGAYTGVEYTTVVQIDGEVGSRVATFAHVGEPFSPIHAYDGDPSISSSFHLEDELYSVSTHTVSYHSHWTGVWGTSIDGPIFLPGPEIIDEDINTTDLVVNPLKVNAVFRHLGVVTKVEDITPSTPCEVYTYPTYHTLHVKWAASFSPTRILVSVRDWLGNGGIYYGQPEIIEISSLFEFTAPYKYLDYPLLVT